MRMNARLSCSICLYFEEKSIVLPFDCDSETCPKCGNVNSLSIISLSDGAKTKDISSRNLQDLIRIRQL